MYKRRWAAGKEATCKAARSRGEGEYFERWTGPALARSKCVTGSRQADKDEMLSVLDFTGLGLVIYII